MAHNPFIHILRQLMRDYRISQQTGCPVDEVYEQRVERKEASRRNGGMTRRNFLIGAGAAAAATAIPYGLARAKGGGGGGTTNVPIAIIGGGMAGLAAALRLKDAGVTATIFESQLRVGGRLLTDRSKNPKTTCGLCHNPRSGGDTGWAEDQYVDVFGELIDSLGI
jgi:hypothetical protein